MSRPLRSAVKKNVENKESTKMAPLSPSTSMAKSIPVKKTFRYMESFTMRIREQKLFENENDKENRAFKESASSGNSVRQMKALWEEKLISRKNVPVPSGQNSTSTGAIKKRKKSDNEHGEENKIAIPNKRANTGDDDIFKKSRFKIYNDESKKRRVKDDEVKRLEEKPETAVNESKLVVAENKRLDQLISFEVNNRQVQIRSTPVDTIEISPRPKKIKALYRKSLMNKSEESCDKQLCASLYSHYDLPYDDYFMEYELEKQMSIFNVPKQNHQRTVITNKQRTIIVKFLTRLNCHLFYPSYFLYQTVELFDSILDATEIAIEDLQLNALAAMWIVLKREHTAYKIPTAETMISFSKDLYEGKTNLLLNCEKKILQTLNFNIAFPDPFSILFYNITKCNRSQFMSTREITTAYYCGNYMIDLSLFDQYLRKISAILLAAAAAEVALYFTMEEVKDTTEPLWFTWRAPHIAKIFTDEEIHQVRSTLIKKISESAEKHTDGEIVFKKYNRSRYGRISHFLGNKVRSYLYPE